MRLFSYEVSGVVEVLSPDRERVVPVVSKWTWNIAAHSRELADAYVENRIRTIPGGVIRNCTESVLTAIIQVYNTGPTIHV